MIKNLVLSGAFSLLCLSSLSRGAESHDDPLIHFEHCSGEEKSALCWEAVPLAKIARLEIPEGSFPLVSKVCKIRDRFLVTLHVCHNDQGTTLVDAEKTFFVKKSSEDKQVKNLTLCSDPLNE